MKYIIAYMIGINIGLAVCSIVWICYLMLSWWIDRFGDCLMEVFDGMRS